MSHRWPASELVIILMSNRPIEGLTYLAHMLCFLKALSTLQYTILQALNLSFASEVANVGTVSSLTTSSLFSCSVAGAVFRLEEAIPNGAVRLRQRNRSKKYLKQ